MLEPDVVDLLESGCGILVGFVTAAGGPFATRGWGLTVLDDGARVRVLVGSDDVARLGYPANEISTMVAVTGCNILTLRSIQLKGPVISMEPADSDEDMERLRTYCEAFFDDVAVVDSVPRYLMERLVPPKLLAFAFEIVEVYDQTPGPNAGASVAARAT